LLLARARTLFHAHTRSGWVRDHAYSLKMSCHLLSKAHIDLLIDLIFEGPEGLPEGVEEIWTQEDDLDPNEIGRRLAMENLRNYVWYRSYNVIANEHPQWEYEDARIGAIAWKRAKADDYTACDRALNEAEDIAWRREYVHTPRSRKLSIAEAIAACGRWEYNSCDRPGARKTLTYNDISALVDTLIGYLPGYAEFESPTEDNSPPRALAAT
jgi:hypothetical protein